MRTKPPTRDQLIELLRCAADAAVQGRGLILSTFEDLYGPCGSGQSPHGLLARAFEARLNAARDAPNAPYEVTCLNAALQLAEASS